MRYKKKKMSQDELLHEVTETEYKYGFYSNVETDRIAVGLSEDVIRMISAKKESPSG